MNEGYKTIPGLARMLNTSDATVRRYIKLYPQYFRSKKIDGWDQFPVEESLKILRRINEVSQAGQRRSEVVKVLQAEFKEKEAEPEDTDTDMSEVVLRVDPEVKAILERIAVALEKAVTLA